MEPGFKKYVNTFLNSSSGKEFKIIMFTHLVLGSYFSLFSSKFFSLILRVYCIIVRLLPLILTVMAKLRNPEMKLILPAIIDICDIVLELVASQITSQKYLITFVNNLNTYDTVANFKISQFSFETFIRIFVVFTLIPTIFNTGFIAFLFYGDLVITLSYGVVWATVFWRYYKLGVIMIFMYKRLKILSQTLENINIPVNIIEKQKINENLGIIRKCLLYYHNILDAFDEIDCYMQFEVGI